MDHKYKTYHIGAVGFGKKMLLNQIITSLIQQRVQLDFSCYDISTVPEDIDKNLGITVIVPDEFKELLSKNYNVRDIPSIKVDSKLDNFKVNGLSHNKYSLQDLLDKEDVDDINHYSSSNQSKKLVKICSRKFF